MPTLTVRRVATVGAVLAGLVLVALAARSYRPFGGERAVTERAHSTLFVDSVFTLVLVLVVALASVVFLLRLGAIRAGRGGRTDPLRALVTFLAIILLFAAVGRDAFNRFKSKPQGDAGESAFPALVKPKVRVPPQAGSDRVTPRVVWPIVGGIGGLVLLTAVAAAIIFRRRTRGDSGSEEALAELRQALDEAIDDLGRDPDPRRAVVAAYARMERALSVYGLPRRPAEAPYEYLERAGAELEAERSVAALTELFEQAKFSEHVVDEPMRERAIGALSAVRDEVRAAAPA